MVKQKPFHKSTATTYTLLHRPQHDPLTNDPDAPSQVFHETSAPTKPGTRRVKERGDLDEEFGLSLKSGQIRKNEGEAAEHGVFYDDSTYDYMQHMREIGNGAGEAVWIEAQKPSDKEKGKQKVPLEDALRQATLDDDVSDVQSISGLSYATRMTSRTLQRSTYELQQDVPDALRGFQPDMDPRLREVLEALEDEAYVEDEEEDFFKEIAGDGEEIDEYDWEEQGYMMEDEGWESDTTERAMPLDPPSEMPAQLQDTDLKSIPSQGTQTDDGVPLQQPPPDIPDSDDFMTNFSKYKREKAALEPPKPAPVKQAAPSDLLSTATGMSRKKKRKGALTNASGFSMTSSSIARTEALSTLDARFDKIEQEYMEEIPEDDEMPEDSMSMASGMTGTSRATAKTSRTNASRSAWGGSQVSNAPSLVMAGSAFDSAMDEFLGSAGKGGGKLKKGGRAAMTAGQSGMDQLNEIRSGLGPARLSQRKTSRA